MGKRSLIIFTGVLIGVLVLGAGSDTREIPFTVPFSKASSLTGLFTLSSGDFLAFAILLAVTPLAVARLPLGGGYGSARQGMEPPASHRFHEGQYHDHAGGRGNRD